MVSLPALEVQLYSWGWPMTFSTKGANRKETHISPVTKNVWCVFRYNMLFCKLLLNKSCHAVLHRKLWLTVLCSTKTMQLLYSPFPQDKFGFFCTLSLIISIFMIIYDVLQIYYDKRHSAESWNSLLMSPLARLKTKEEHMHLADWSKNTINASLVVSCHVPTTKTKLNMDI